MTDAKVGIRSISDSSAPATSGTISSTLNTLLNYFANRIKAITGEASWNAAPLTNLRAVKAHMDDGTIHGGTSSGSAVANAGGTPSVRAGTIKPSSGDATGQLFVDYSGSDAGIFRWNGSSWVQVASVSDVTLPNLYTKVQTLNSSGSITGTALPDSSSDTLYLKEGTGIDLSVSGDTITIASTGSSGSGVENELLTQGGSAGAETGLGPSYITPISDTIPSQGENSLWLVIATVDVEILNNGNSNPKQVIMGFLDGGLATSRQSIFTGHVGDRTQMVGVWWVAVSSTSSKSIAVRLNCSEAGGAQVIGSHSMLTTFRLS